MNPDIPGHSRSPRGWSRSTFLAILLFLVAGCARPLPAPPEPPQSDPRIEAVLAQAGGNRPELEAALALYTQDTPEYEAARFLVRNLPPVDAVAMSAELLAEHVGLALRARRQFPWRRTVPHSLWLHYVLPHRTSQEPLEPWRGRLQAAIAPRLSGVADMAEAANRIALWCVKRIDYVPTSGLDQGPLATLARGRARCEEAVILFVAACRSVGIPARMALTPAWQFTNDNHAWAEVWLAGQGREGEWRAVDPANPRFPLDMADYPAHPVRPAQRAVLVHVLEYGGPAEADAEKEEPVLRNGPGYVVRNVTARYAPTHELAMRVLDADGHPLPRARITVSVFNYGTFAPVARVVCDETGTGRIDLGRSTVLLTASRNGKTDYALVPVGQEGAEELVTLDLRRNRLPEGGFRMRFGAPPPRESGLAPDAKEAWEARKKRRDEQGETDRLRAVRRAVMSLGLSDEDQQETALLDEAGHNAGAVGEALMRAALRGGKHRETILAALEAMTPKDLAVCTAEAVLADAEAAMTARRMVRDVLGLRYTDEMFRDHVLSSRLTESEPYSLYRAALAGRFGPLLAVPQDMGAALSDTPEQVTLRVAAVAREVNRWAASLKPSPGNPFGPTSTPMQVLAARAATARERVIACMAGLRSLGIPVRESGGGRWMEYFDGTGWVPLYPERPGDLGRPDKSPEARRFYGPRGELRLAFSLNGIPLTEEDRAYYGMFSLSTFRMWGEDKENNGYRAQEPGKDVDLGFDEKTGSYVLRLAPGPYHLIGGDRNAVGEPYVRVKRLRIEAGQVVQGGGVLDGPGE